MNHLEKRTEHHSYSNEVKPDTERFSVMQEPGSNSSATPSMILTLKR